MNECAWRDSVFAARACGFVLGKKMKQEMNDAPVGERLAGAEAAREARMLDQILADIQALEREELPTVESPRPRLVLVR